MATTKKVKKEEIVEAEVISEPKQAKKPANEEKISKNISRRDSGRFFWGMLLVVLGVMFALENYLEIDVWQNFWPIIIILIGMSIIFGSFYGSKE
jgi:uncharacterized integral membrane protein